MPDTRAQTKNHQVVLDGPGTNVPGTGTGPARVCLISLYNTIAPGLRVLSAVLKERGHQVEVVFLHGDVSTCNHPEPVSDAELGLLNDLCLDLKPDLVGLGVTSSFLHPLAREVTASLRQAVDAPIVWGGSHATIMPEECVDFADFVCVGEGEYSLPALVEAVQSGNSRAIREVPGLVYCDGDAIFRNRDRAPVRDLDSLPYQDIDATGKYLVECDRVVRLEPLSIRSTYPTYASRGCPFECTFCSRDLINEASGLTRAIRYRSPEHVIGELEIAKRTCVNIRTIRFWDDTFPIRASWLREFCQLYAERIGLPFEVWLHPRSARLDSLRMMRQAGLSSVGMGIESGSQRLRRDLFGRPETQEDSTEDHSPLTSRTTPSVPPRPGELRAGEPRQRLGRVALGEANDADRVRGRAAFHGDAVLDGRGPPARVAKHHGLLAHALGRLPDPLGLAQRRVEPHDVYRVGAAVRAGGDRAPVRVGHRGDGRVRGGRDSLLHEPGERGQAAFGGKTVEPLDHHGIDADQHRTLRDGRLHESTPRFGWWGWKG